MKYDDASWHYGGDFPAGLPSEAGATHIAMFVAWAVLNGLEGGLHMADDLAKLRDRSITPGRWFISACDEAFTDEDLNAEGNAFTRAYYAGEDDLRTEPGSYLADYADAFPACETLYHVPDTWETFAALDPVIRTRFGAWRAAH